MEVSLKTWITYGAVVLNGLSAGLFYAWSVSVIPGTRQLVDYTYLQTMQSINRAILNPAFYFIFFGSAVFLGIATIYHYSANNTVFWLLLASSICYIMGTIVVTGLGNVPLNNQLEALNLGEITTKKISEFRHFYETSWNQLHLIRTVFAVMSFLLSALAVLIYSKN